MISIQEAAARLGVSRFLLHRLIAENEIPSIKLGARRLIPRAVIDAMVAGTYNGQTANQL
jgi:excisionase family DNA binding protein